MIYLIHFDEPFLHARHYLGYAEEGNFEARINHHKNGTGANLIKVITLAGIKWNVVRTWPNGTRTEERSLKCHGHARICPICSPQNKRAMRIGNGSRNFSMSGYGTSFSR